MLEYNFKEKSGVDPKSLLIFVRVSLPYRHAVQASPAEKKEGIAVRGRFLNVNLL